MTQLLAADFLPPVWLPDERTRTLRRQIARRTHLVRQRTRLKNQVHAILARNFAPTCPVSDLFGRAGRHWLCQQQLPGDERRSVEALIRQLDFHGAELKAVDRKLAVEALDDPVVARLMTIPGIDSVVALSIVSAVGDFSRFPSPDKLVSYLGLHPKVRQSGESPANLGRITKAGHSHARGMIVEAAWSASRAPGPLRAFYRRIAVFSTAASSRGRTLRYLRSWRLRRRAAGPRLRIGAASSRRPRCR